VFSIAIVGRHDGHAVGVRDAEKRDGARLPRLGAGGGEDDRRQAGRDPGEAALAAGELADQLVQAVCRRSEEHPARLRGGDGAHRSMKRICIVEETHWHSGSFAEIQPTPSRIATFIDACPGA